MKSKYLPLLLILFTACMCAPVGAQTPLRVQIEGVEGPLLDNVRALLTIEQEKEQEGLAERRIRRYHRRAATEIEQALQPFGYYQVQTQAQLVHEQDTWVARYQITPGEPARLSASRVVLHGEGAELPEMVRAVEALALREGAIAVHADYEAARNSLQRKAISLGFLDAAYRVHELRVNVHQNQAQAVLELDTGPRYRFGELRFDAVGLSSHLLQRYVRFKEGDVFSHKVLLDLQRALEDSTYFARVDVVPEPERAQELKVPVHVMLEERKRSKYSFGIGYGTDSGARTSIGWERRRINKRGHRLGADLQLSQVRQGLRGRYVVPMADPRTDQVEFSISTLNEKTDDVESRSRDIAASHSHMLGGWKQTQTLRLLQEEFEIGGIADTSTLLYPEWALTRVSADDRMNTRRGYRIQFKLRGASEALFSSTDLMQVELESKLVLPLGEDGRLLARGAVGASMATDFSEVPASLRFFTGGDQSVRGFSFDSLAPRNAAGDVIGGEHMLVGSVEYEHRIRGAWSLAAFVDVGNAFDDFDIGLEKGAGIGVRWQSPIGPVRLDLASALSKEGHPIRLHFVLGPDL